MAPNHSKANLPKIRIHDGRHTNAARLRQAGVPLEDIKDMLGHKNVKTTEIYAHVSAEVKERAVNKLELYQMYKNQVTKTLPDFIYINHHLYHQKYFKANIFVSPQS